MDTFSLSHDSHGKMHKVTVPALVKKKKVVPLLLSPTLAVRDTKTAQVDSKQLHEQGIRPFLLTAFLQLIGIRKMDAATSIGDTSVHWAN